MAFPGSNYAPPGPYTKTLFENPLTGALETFKVPVLIGEGNEALYQQDLEVVRGSSSTADTRVAGEDETGRAVVSISAAGVITRGDFDGVLDKFQVRNYPIVSGDGTGTTSTNRQDVVVTVNGAPTVVRSLQGATGIVQLATPPKTGDLVRCTYFFDRTDTYVTDDVSAQVPNRAAIVDAVVGLADVNAPVHPSTPLTLDLHGDILGPDGIAVAVPANNVLSLTVDGTSRLLTIPPRTDYTMAQVAAAITALRAGNLTAATFVNNYGHSALRLTSPCSLVIKDASANAPLGLVANSADLRTSTFYTFNGPIVDGSGGGVTTTDPAHVTVKVDGRQVIPTSVDGATRAVTLPQAPKAGARVSIAYFFNTWQDTFDYLFHTGITQVTSCGDVPGGSGYTQEADFILQNDRIVWGTAATVDSGVNTAGKEPFGETQVSLSLVDNRTFMAACEPVVQTSGGIAVASQLQFTLPFQPTLGNGRDTPIGQSLFQTISNGRIDVPVDRPDVIWAYWGYGVQDALVRGRVEVIKVDGLVITLDESVPVGATVYATLYYNTLTDQTYTLTCKVAGVSGTGTYGITDSDGGDVFGASFPLGSKSAALNGIVIEFPSGSELTPDARFESVDDTLFTGPVEEIVTVAFAARTATPAKWAVPGAGPYDFISGASDHLRIKAHGTDVFTSAGMDLTAPNFGNPSFFASLVSDEIVYDGSPKGKEFDITSPEEFTLVLDGDDVPVNTGTGSNKDIQFIADAINAAAGGQHGHGTGAASTLQLAAGYINVTNYYQGWKVVIGNNAVVGAPAGGTVRTITSSTSGGVVTVDSPWAAGAFLATPYNIYNPDTRAHLTGSTVFNGPVDLTAGFNLLKIHYVGDVSTALDIDVALAVGPWTTPVLLAAEVNSKIAAAIALLVPASNWLGLAIECVANSSSKLEFRLRLPGVDTAGFIQFLDVAGGEPSNFAALAGIEYAAAEGDGQTALMQGPIARTRECPDLPATGFKLYDRLILRNRILPGLGFVRPAGDQIEVKIENTRFGLLAGMAGMAGFTAASLPAYTNGVIGFTGGQEVATGEPVVKFYDGTGTVPANNYFAFEIDGVPVGVEFEASATGTETPLGPGDPAWVPGGPGSIISQIAYALANVPGTPFGAIGDTLTNNVGRWAAGFWLSSSLIDALSRIVIGTGSANGVLGLTTGAISLRATVPAKRLASALMAHRGADFPTWLLDVTDDGVGTFTELAIASTVEDAAGAEYLYLQDTPILLADLGTASSIGVFNTLNGVADALRLGTGLSALDGDGDTGEAAVNGFYVTSSVVGGSGSADDSVLNNGTGQDGIVGQTYRDRVTGLTFTILPRNWHTSPSGPWLAYPTSSASFRINVSKTFTTDANLPVRAINGVEMKVANTVNVGVADTAIVTTYERGGNEPKNGDLYYVTYMYTKQDFTTAFYTKMSSVEKAFGAAIPDNPLSLATYLAMMNGAVLVGCKQVQRESGQQQAGLTAYRNAIDELEGVLPGYVLPDMILPLRGDSLDLFQHLKKSNDIQSSLRYRAERTSIIGLAAGTLPRDAMSWAQALGNTRMRMVYPDMATINVQDNVGNTKEYLVDGTFVAAALMGSVVSPNVDVATPWTGRRLVGFVQLARTLDAVEQNQIAVKGITVLEDKPPFLRVRHGLTTDMSSILTKLPTIVLIADEVQKQARSTLERFIGIKNLPGVSSQIEGSLSMMLKALVAAQIITAYMGVKANVDPLDPTVANVEAYYSPVFPLLYIVVTFHLRSSL